MALDPTIPLRGDNMLDLRQKAQAVQENAMRLRAMPEAIKREQEMGQIKQKAARLEQAMQQNEFIARNLSGATDPVSYQRVRAGLAAQGLDVSDLPETFDPQVVRSHLMTSMSIKDQLEAEANRIKAQQDAEKFGLDSAKTRSEIAVNMGKMGISLPYDTNTAFGGVAAPEPTTAPSTGEQTVASLVGTPNPKAAPAPTMKPGVVMTNPKMAKAEDNVVVNGKLVNRLTGEPVEPPKLKYQQQVKQYNAYKGTFERMNNVVKKIDDLKGKVNLLTAGVIGQVGSWIGGTPQKDLKANLETVLANLGFEELQRMRDESPTGGALGQVTERELAFLQSVKANLENSQSPEQLKENLDSVRQQIVDSWKRIDDAYRAERGAPPREDATQTPAPQGNAPAIGTVEDGHRFKGGNPADPSAWEKI